ncbi:MAG: hypothetical protein M3680_34335, partial [Myxococcota bacterium]|nr:hypothetical protein [Myxococcota bacterium]
EGDGVPGATPAAPTGPASAAGATPTTDAVTIDHETAYTAPSGANTRTSVGVGELVYFSSSAAGTWAATAGTRTGSGQDFEWTAPATAATVTVTFTPATGAAVTRSIEVLAPSAVVMTKTSEKTFPSGTAGSGFVASVALHPLTVSFAATEWKEATGQAGTGAVGYFAQAGMTLPVHEANPAWLGIGEGNSGPTDNAAFSGFTMRPFDAGSFQWDIQQSYKLRTEAGAGHPIVTLPQVGTMEGAPNAGRMTVSKGGATSAPRSPGGAAATGATDGAARPRGSGESEEPPGSGGAVGVGFSTDGASQKAEDP